MASRGRSPTVALREYAEGYSGYQALLEGTTSPGTTKYYACLKYGPRKSRWMAQEWLENQLRKRRRRN